MSAVDEGLISRLRANGAAGMTSELPPLVATRISAALDDHREFVIRTGTAEARLNRVAAGRAVFGDVLRLYTKAMMAGAWTALTLLLVRALLSG